MSLISFEETLESIVISEEMLNIIAARINPLLVRLEKSNLSEDGDLLEAIIDFEDKKRIVVWPRDFYERERPEIDKELRFSSAADIFLEALNNPSETLKWWTKGPVYSDASTDKKVIGSLLEEAKKKSYNYLKDRRRHITECIVNGENPGEEEFQPHFRIEWPSKGEVDTIVFDRGELIGFFENNQIEHSVTKPLPITALQDNLSTLFDDKWITGDIALCRAFKVKKNSITSVRIRVKKAKKEFEYDPETGEKRLRLSTILNILAGD